jgi:uncharacterized protein
MSRLHTDRWEKHSSAFCVAKLRRSFFMPDKQKDDKKMTRSEAGRKGGEAAHEKGTAHEWDSKEARAAGQKGGEVAHEKGTAHEFSGSEARKAGQKGGEASHERGSRRHEGEEKAR